MNSPDDTRVALATADPAAAIKTDQTASWIVEPQGPSDPLLGCLVAIAALLERPKSAEGFTAGLPLIDLRLTPALFVRAAARAGLSAAITKRSLADIPRYAVPCVLLLEERGACVLTKLDKGRAEIIVAESGSGTTSLPLDDLARVYTGRAIFVRPEHRFDSRDEDVRSERPSSWFWGTILLFWPTYLEVCLAALIINLLALTGSLFAMNVYDRVVPNSAFETLWVLAIGTAVVFVFDLVLRTLRSYFLDVAGRRADVLLASRIFEHVLGVKMMARPASAGAFANHLREFETLRDFFTSSTLAAVIDLPFALIFMLVIWALGGKLAFVPLVAFPAVAVVGLIIQIPLNRAVTRTFREGSQKHGLLVEAIGGLETIKSLGGEGRTLRRWEGLVGTTARAGVTVRTLSMLAINFSLLAQNLVSITMIVVGVYMIAGGELTVGGLIACTILGSRAMLPLSQIAALFTRFEQSRASLNALNAVMKMPVERPDGASFVHRPDLKGDIELRNVTFAYPNQKIGSLNGATLRIRAGERVGIIGRVGSGKSTIARLLIGLYEPQAGAVLIDGTDVRQLDPANLRRRVGCVLQDVYLFFGTVRDNILQGAPHADDAALLRAARLAGVDDFVARHPSGYDLQVGERGEALSGGQRQAIGLARAFVGDPPILLLDEPTSAMDHTSESRFKNRLVEVLAGKTLILITHRTSMLSLVDRLLVIDGGRVVADGPRDAVLAALTEGKVRTSN